MQDGAVEQIGHGGKTNVRVRPHIMVVASLYLQRSEMVKKHKRPHRLTAGYRQQAADQKAAAQVLGLSGQP